MNKVMLIGRLTKAVEMRTVGQDTALANFTLAVDRRFKSKNEGQPTADFIPVSVWRKTAEFAEKYFHKGKQVYVCGSLETYTYEQNGERKYGFRVNADEIGFADGAKSDGSGTAPANKGNSGGTTNEFSDFAGSADFGDPSGFDMMDTGDDLPF